MGRPRKEPQPPKRPERDNHHWTKEEDEILMEMAGQSTYDSIGSKLKRSPRAVENRMRELDTTDALILTGMMTAAELGRLVQRDKSYIIKLINEDGLPATKPKVTYKKRDPHRWMIDPYKFWKWAEKNRDKFNFHLIEKDSILPEPLWVEEQRRIDFEKPVTRKRWTDEERKRAIQLLDAGYSRPQVAKALNRSVSSIRWVLDKHLEELGIKSKK
jgi:hypothetical protein